MYESVRIWRMANDIVIELTTGKTSKRIVVTEDEAQHISNRLQSFAKGNHGAETIYEYGA